MKKALLFSLGFLFLTSCFNIESQLIINPDGSGEIVNISKVSMALAALGKLGDTTNNFMSTFVDDSESTAKHFVENSNGALQFVETTSDSTQGMFTVISKVSFDDITEVKLPITGIFDSSFSPHDTTYYASFSKKKSKVFMHLNKGVSLSDSVIAPEASPQESDTKTEDIDAMLQMFVKDMHIRFVVIPRGKFSTNATYANDTAITIFNIDFNKFINSPTASSLLDKPAPKDSVQDELDSLKKEISEQETELALEQTMLKFQQADLDSILDILDSTQETNDATQKDITTRQDEINIKRRKLNATQREIKAAQKALKVRQESHDATKEENNPAQNRPDFVQFLHLGESAGIELEPKEQITIKLK